MHRPAGKVREPCHCSSDRAKLPESCRSDAHVSTYETTRASTPVTLTFSWASPDGGRSKSQRLCWQVPNEPSTSQTLSAGRGKCAQLTEPAKQASSVQGLESSQRVSSQLNEAHMPALQRPSLPSRLQSDSSGRSTCSQAAASGSQESAVQGLPSSQLASVQDGESPQAADKKAKQTRGANKKGFTRRRYHGAACSIDIRLRNRNLRFE